MLLGYAGGNAQYSSDIQLYISQYKQIALEQERQYGIPVTITLAQGILESGAGTSSLTKASNNHFCIKAGSSWKGRVYLAWDDEKTKSRFRCYNTAMESFKDYACLLKTSKYYHHLFNISVYDYRSWAHELKKAGYATASDYAKALIGIIDQYKLYTINGGVKLRPGKAIVITKYVDREKPVFDDECMVAEEEVTEEQNLIIDAIQQYVVEINHVHCTTLQPGETLASISRKHNISFIDLLKYNELNSEYRIKEGDIIFLAKKKKKYKGAQDFYFVKNNDTLYNIAQQFGIRLHQLAKLNNLNDYARLNEGTRIVLK